MIRTDPTDPITAISITIQLVNFLICQLDGAVINMPIAADNEIESYSVSFGRILSGDRITGEQRNSK